MLGGAALTSQSSKGKGKGKPPVVIVRPPEFALVQKADLVFLGSFNLPTGNLGGTGKFFRDQSAGGIAYDPNDGRLFAGCDFNTNWVGKVTIPALGSQTLSTPYASLPVATQYQNPVDLTEGTQSDAINIAGGQEPAIGGLIVHGTDLYHTQYVIYDGGHTQTVETWKHSTDLPTAGHSGPWHIQSPQSAGYVSGALCAIPAAWQSALGGKIISSQTGVSIIGRTSYGPNAHSWDPANFAASTPSYNLLYYNDPNFFSDGSTLYPWLSQAPSPWPWVEAQGKFWNGSHLMRGGGIVIPDGFRSYLHFGCVGRGHYWYGLDDPTNNPPSPPVFNDGVSGADASTNGAGTRITVPNADLSAVQLAPVGEEYYICWLSEQSTPVRHPNSNNSVALGCANIVGKGNSGTPTAYVDVDVAFTGNLTSQDYVVGKNRIYDPQRPGQGNHAWPYTYVCYAYDLNDLAAAKAGTKNPYDIVPYAMWDIAALLPDTASQYSQIHGVAWDAAGRRLFIELILTGASGTYKTIVVFQVAP